MGLIRNLVMSITHLLFVAMDILALMILAKAIYDRWHFAWLKPFADSFAPAVNSVTSHFGTWLSKATGKSYSEKVQLLSLIVCLWLLQVVIVAVLK